MEETKKALQGVKNAKLEEILTETPYKEVLDFLKEGTTQSVEVGDACLNTDEFYKLVDGRVLVVSWVYANEWANTPRYKVVDTIDQALDYYKQNYTDRAKAWGQASIDEWRKSEGWTEDEASQYKPLEEWEDLILTCWACD